VCNNRTTDQSAAHSQSASRGFGVTYASQRIPRPLAGSGSGSALWLWQLWLCALASLASGDWRLEGLWPLSGLGLTLAAAILLDILDIGYWILPSA
jgi:hypothetical protein